MKAFKILLVMMLVCVTTISAQDKKKKTDTVCFDVSLSCHGCQAKIEKNIPWEKGVKDLKVNLEDKTVCIEYDTKKTSPEKLKAAIEKLEFTCDIKDQPAEEKVQD
ncbi:heavy-metal-associated domain-containing protein [Dysgonomonas massiliensis]|uniref:heavy-metal-associated domain-containing protein n=1 Tax=Dysgonomonas massiliensis TaxID=2040292 RepID=UPI001FE82B65|nr:heavy metal-associated domain-containing protein [Dysgonomonas massiliensis]